MPLESEIIGEFNRELFEAKREEFTTKFGAPTVKKRLGLMVFDRNNPDVDTRVRITNGQAEVMQKVKKSEDGSGHFVKDEISYAIPSTVDAVYNAFLTYTNLLQAKYHQQLIRLLVQTENYVWQLPDYELKISHQFGQNDYYTFEIEALTADCDLARVQETLGLTTTANFASTERKLFRQSSVDLDADKLSETEIKTIISDYLS